MTTEHNKRTTILLNVAHYLTALVILLKGLSKIGIPGKEWIAIVSIFVAVSIVLGTIFHHRFEKTLRHFKAYTYAVEALVLSMVGYLYIKEGKQFLQYACFFASAMFIVALIIYIRS